MVTMPAVPPYSSTTTAMCRRSACISRSRSSTGLESGTWKTGRIIDSTCSVVWAAWRSKTRLLMSLM